MAYPLKKKCFSNGQTNGQTDEHTNEQTDGRSDYIMPQNLFGGINIVLFVSEILFSSSKKKGCIREYSYVRTLQKFRSEFSISGQIKS